MKTIIIIMITFLHLILAKKKNPGYIDIIIIYDRPDCNVFLRQKFCRSEFDLLKSERYQQRHHKDSE
jgi:hypothetical protein